MNPTLPGDSSTRTPVVNDKGNVSAKTTLTNPVNVSNLIMALACDASEIRFGRS